MKKQKKTAQEFSGRGRNFNAKGKDADLMSGQRQNHLPVEELGRKPTAEESVFSKQDPRPSLNQEAFHKGTVNKDRP